MSSPLNNWMQGQLATSLSDYMKQAYPDPMANKPNPTSAEYGSLPPGQLPVEASPLVGADTNANNSWILGNQQQSQTASTGGTGTGAARGLWSSVLSGI